MRLIEIPDDGIVKIPIMRGKYAVGSRNIDLSDSPTVDAVPVVRCFDCSYYGPNKRCIRSGLYTLENDFCSYGVWKEGADNG